MNDKVVPLVQMGLFFFDKVVDKCLIMWYNIIIKGGLIMRYTLNGEVFDSKSAVVNRMCDSVLNTFACFGYWDVSGSDVDGIFVMSGKESVARVVLSQRRGEFKLRKREFNEILALCQIIERVGFEYGWRNYVSELIHASNKILLVCDIEVPMNYHIQFLAEDDLSFSCMTDAVFQDFKSRYSSMVEYKVVKSDRKLSILVLSGSEFVAKVFAADVLGQQYELDSSAEVVKLWSCCKKGFDDVTKHTVASYIARGVSRGIYTADVEGTFYIINDIG